MPIRILPINVSSQISSGEIVRQPSSVIKELMENSIDAGAKNIHVNIEKSGLALIYVRDDGMGIDKKELLLAISHHATSKIVSLNDLTVINTFGFRGEALASIRSVSRFTIISSTPNHEYAWKVYSEGYNDEYIDIQPIAHPLGTSVFVEDLFYNIPIRLKFMKSIKQEYLKILSVFNKIVLSHFNINFVLIHNKKIIVKHNSVSEQNIKIKRLKKIFPFININKLLTIQSQHKNIKIFGWISSPQHEKFLKKIQYCYVNNRYVYNNTMNDAVNTAYKNYLGNAINLFFILYLYLPAHEIDVNIHPTKNEIKFHYPNTVFHSIYTAILNVLNIYFPIKKSHNFVVLHKKYSSNQLIIHDNQIQCSAWQTVPIFKKKILNTDMICQSNIKIINQYKHIFGTLLVIVQKYYGLIHIKNDFFLISFPFASKLMMKYQFQSNIKQNTIPVLILTNIKIDITCSENTILLNYRDYLLQLGIRVVLKSQYVIIQTVPVFFQRTNIKKLIVNFLKYLYIKTCISILEMIDWLYKNIEITLNDWKYADGMSILLEIEYYYPFLFINPPSELLQKIDINSALRMLKI